MKKLFVYGTLIDKGIQKGVLGREVSCREDTLLDYSKKPHTIFKVYPTIKKHTGDSVNGVVLDVTDHDLNLLDRYESNLYKKIDIKLASGIEAITYIES
jgi:gamma-glutamylcyclotransferase (GGCT)/AIG2-like uncharacterized protein YtfP|tara:strand:+ start:472 stop:768 length:297 start_codon:yes stop_codon:yes gene_type:complete